MKKSKFYLSSIILAAGFNIHETSAQIQAVVHQIAQKRILKFVQDAQLQGSPIVKATLVKEFRSKKFTTRLYQPSVRMGSRVLPLLGAHIRLVVATPDEAKGLSPSLVSFRTKMPIANSPVPPQAATPLDPNNKATLFQKLKDNKPLGEGFVYSDPSQWKEQLIYQSNASHPLTEIPLTLVWQLNAERVRTLASDLPQNETIYIDSDAKVIARKSNISFASGHAEGLATSGVYPQLPTTPEEVAPLANAYLKNAQSSILGTSDGEGNFNLNSSPGLFSEDSVTLSLEGPYVKVLDVFGPTISQEMPLASTMLFSLNSPSNINSTAQVNTFTVVNKTHDYVKKYLPDLTEIDQQILASVNVDGICNAYYMLNTVNFFPESFLCVNTAYSTIISHEYGHFINSALGHEDPIEGQGAFGEGLADTIAYFVYDDPILGRNFMLSGNYLRNAQTTQVTYPCSGDSHECGQTLAGIFWKIYENFKTSMGSSAAYEAIRRLHADWMYITDGGAGEDSAHTQTAIEVLTADDDNANLLDGTPHYSDICSSFYKFGISCPPVQNYQISFPAGLPEMAIPSKLTTLKINITAISAGRASGPLNVVLHYQDANGTWNQSLMKNISDGQFQGQLPATTCMQEMKYYFSIDDGAGKKQNEPMHAPTQTYSTIGARWKRVLINQQNFEKPDGWQIVNSDDLAIGEWGLVDPASYPIWDGVSPQSDFNGSHIAWTTGAQYGYNLVGGTSLRRSLNTKLLNGILVKYHLWMYSFDRGHDQFDVKISTNQGASWETKDNISKVNFNWASKNLLFSVTNKPQTIISFEALNDHQYLAVSEYYLDGVEVTGYSCRLIGDPQNGAPPQQDDDLPADPSDPVNPHGL